MLKSWICFALLLLPTVEAFAADDNVIECAVELTAYLTDQPYHEEVDGSYYDFRVPVATFSVVSPSEFEERLIRVIFLSTDHDGVLTELEHGVGGRFVLRLPADYFGYSDGTTIKGYLIESISPAD